MLMGFALLLFVILFSFFTPGLTLPTFLTLYDSMLSM
jgi:hypothetical protein